jgi:hypothetical protein
MFRGLLSRKRTFAVNWIIRRVNAGVAVAVVAAILIAAAVVVTGAGLDASGYAVAQPSRVTWDIGVAWGKWLHVGIWSA